jgi:cytochrome c biogenesis protein
MLYIRERRLWVWLAPQPHGENESGSRAVMALSANRQTLDTAREFARLRDLLLKL